MFSFEYRNLFKKGANVSKKFTRNKCNNARKIFGKQEIKN